MLGYIIAALTDGGSRAGKRSLIGRIPLSGPAPCPGALRQNKALDEVSASILGDAVAENEKTKQRRRSTGKHEEIQLSIRCQQIATSAVNLLFGPTSAITVSV